VSCAGYAWLLIKLTIGIYFIFYKIWGLLRHLFTINEKQTNIENFT